MINILTLKVHNKYSAEYVNKLYNGIKRNTTVPFTFYCYTEDSTDLNENIKIIPLDNVQEFKLQWHKLSFHKTGFGNIKTDEQCIIMDIDMIIMNNIDEILNWDLKNCDIGLINRWWSEEQRKCYINGGIQIFKMGRTNYLWEIFKKDPDHWQEYYVKNDLAAPPINGEQNFINQHSKNKSFLPKSWVAKWEKDKLEHLRNYWFNHVDKIDPFYVGGEFNDNIKIVHFTVSTNLINNYNEEWIKEHWL